MRILPLIVLIVAGCVRPRLSVPVDPAATFAVHLEPGAGLVVDRLGDRPAGRVRSAGWGFQQRGLRFALESGEGPQASFRLLRVGEVVAWPGADVDSTPLGRIEPAWDDNAIRLTLAPFAGPTLRTDLLIREGGGTGPSALSRAADTTLDVRGTYHAVLRDTTGAAVGWLRARIGPYQIAPRLYDGALPAAVDPLLGVAAALALDSEVDWIQDHAINVHQGKDGGPLEASGFPGR